MHLGYMTYVQPLQNARGGNSVRHVGSRCRWRSLGSLSLLMETVDVHQNLHEPCMAFPCLQGCRWLLGCIR
ncbi:hypothetical protein VNO77_27258 [Canavalia gladiata]|uniref:Uncharacterized protein n=1 Tax=Canavalia gladiata TaxID=3824 RepID=A0AAN9KWM2_CANGL